MKDRYKCLKSLYNNSSQIIKFRKGHTYLEKSSNKDSITLYNTDGDPHIIYRDGWGVHFKKVTLSLLLKQL